MELVDKNMSAFALLPVEGDAVQHGIGNDQQSGWLQLCAETVDIEYDYALIEIHIALMAEDVQ